MHYGFKIQIEYKGGIIEELSIKTYQYQMVEKLPEVILRGSSAIRCRIMDNQDNLMSVWAWKNIEKTCLWCKHYK